jgi:hypothetical protein
MRYFIVFIFSIALAVACSSPIQLTPADFSWPIEAVLTVDEQGFVADNRYSFKVNVKNLFAEEFGVAKEYSGKTIRVIRNSSGIYFITADGFKNIYLLNQDLSALTIAKKIPVSEFGLKNPFFNQRDSYIELVDDNIKIKLSNEGIIGDKK